MPVDEATSSYDAGLTALAARDWNLACAHLERAVEADPTPEALEALGTAYFWEDRQETVETRQAAYRAYRDAGDRRGAARVAIALAFDHVTFRGEVAVGEGWLELASRALAGLPLCAEHGHLAAWEADFALAAADTDLAVRKARYAVEIGRELGDADIELIGRAQEGLVLVFRGEVENGMRLLDATAAAAVAGEILDPAYAGYACCYVINACDLVRDVSRATQWCAKLDQHCRRVGFHALQHLCRAEYAGVLVEQGEWSRAEAEMLAAAEFLGSRRPAMAVEAVVRLAELRRRQGRRQEAAQLFAEAEGHPAALLGMASLALDEGDATTAAGIAERYLRQFLPADRVGRFDGLEVLVRARALSADLDGARAALDEMRSTVAPMRRGPLVAAVHLAEAELLLATGDPAGARRAAEDAVDTYDRAGAPFGAASARAVLSKVLAAVGDPLAAHREASAAAKALEHLGAVADAARVRLGPTRPPVTARELEVLRLVAAGHSNAEIARRLVLSEHTVHRHVANALAKLEVSTRAAAVARATTLGLI